MLWMQGDLSTPGGSDSPLTSPGDLEPRLIANYSRRTGGVVQNDDDDDDDDEDEDDIKTLAIDRR